MGLWILELWDCAAGVGTWMCRGMEIGSLGGMLRAWGRGGAELWRRPAGSRACP